MQAQSPPPLYFVFTETIIPIIATIKRMTFIGSSKKLFLMVQQCNKYSTKHHKLQVKNDNYFYFFGTISSIFCLKVFLNRQNGEICRKQNDMKLCKYIHYLQLHLPKECSHRYILLLSSCAAIFKPMLLQRTPITNCILTHNSL